MINSRKVIYTQSAKEKLERLHLQVNHVVDRYFQERKYVPGDDFIEITAVDVDEVSRLIQIAKPKTTKITRLIVPLLYSAIGFACVLLGLYYEEILSLMMNNPRRLVLITMGAIMITVSWSYLYLSRLQDRLKQSIEQVTWTAQGTSSPSAPNMADDDTGIDETESKKNITVHSARYFADKNYLNVTSIVKSLVANEIFEFAISNDLMGGDPFYGKVKDFEVVYTAGGEEKTLVAREGSTVKLD